MKQERLLYESHGCSEKVKIIFTIILISEESGVFLLVLSAILFFPIANLDDDMSALIVIFAAIIVLIAVIIICSMIFSSCKKCWIRLYETGMDGKSLISSGTGGRQRFSYQDIQHASIQTIFLVIQVNGVQHKFMSADNQRALQIINSCMQRHYQHIQ